MRKTLSGIVLFSMGVLVASAQPSKSVIGIHGLPVGKAVTAPVHPPFLTKDQLFSRGHAEDYVEITQLLNTYIYYHDTGNGPGIGSLFTPDGIFEVLNNKDGRSLDPDYGDFKGCIARGPDQIATFFGSRPGKPLSDRATPFPRPGHNQVTNVLVKIDGNTATVNANWSAINADPQHKKSITSAYVDRNGQYVVDLKNTPDGWRFVQLRAVHEYAPQKSTSCDAEGVLPR